MAAPNRLASNPKYRRSNSSRRKARSLAYASSFLYFHAAFGSDGGVVPALAPSLDLSLCISAAIFSLASLDLLFCCFSGWGVWVGKRNDFKVCGPCGRYLGSSSPICSSIRNQILLRYHVAASHSPWLVISTQDYLVVPRHPASISLC